MTSSFVHSFILETYIAPLQETTTQRRTTTQSAYKDSVGPMVAKTTDASLTVRQFT